MTKTEMDAVIGAVRVVLDAGVAESLRAHIAALEADNAAFRVLVRGWAVCLRMSIDCGDVEMPVAAAVEIRKRTGELKTQCGQPHPGAALLEVVNAIRQYQRADEPDVSVTLRRLLEERGRIAHMVPPDQHRKALVRARNEGLEKAAEIFDRAVTSLQRYADNATGEKARLEWAEAAEVEASHARSIRAMKEPESEG